jgi:hypothetical protein
MLQVGFEGENLGEYIQCQAELEVLAERMQAEHGDLVTPQQCEEAKGSLESFIVLIDQAQEKAGIPQESASPPRKKSPKLG